LIAEMGKKLRAAREKAGVSQESLAQEIGMTRTNLARIEHGGANVTVETLVRFAGGLGLEVALSLKRKDRSSSRRVEPR
jgi:XRE family aerobic/anaerobic benzoate catabolism transcriptional regulator